MKSLPALLSVAIALPITAIALPLGARDAPPVVPSPAPSSSTVPRSSYAEFMRLGYAALQRQDYSIASSYFRQALYYNPNDRAATIAYWNARDGLRKQEKTSRRESAYDRHMRIGYDATNRGDYHTAYINFERALQERPNNYYATRALRNVSTYIARGEGQQIANLPEPTNYSGESAYDRYMRLGYAAAQRGDRGKATQHFLGALYERPRDRLASIAFRNTIDALAAENRADAPAGDTVSDYDRSMQLGYEATERGNYSVALTYFRQALQERPNDEYATRALRNVRAYMELGQAGS